MTAGFDLQVARSGIEAARRALAIGQEGSGPYRQLVDRLVRELGAAAGWSEPGRALVALGGFGRGELAPRSDIDLLFLIRGRAKGPPPVDGVLYPLWDLGFEVGHAVRTAKDCAELAAEDLTAATALLDGRLLLGDADLLAEAKRRSGIRPEGSRRMTRWVDRILLDVEVRRTRFGEVSHLLEPHIKEGTGGLRDYHSARWVLACLGRDPDREILWIPGGREAGEAYAFLSRTRNVLHAVAGRKTDQLTFDFHREVASLVLPDVALEGFFEALHRAGHRIGAVWDAASSEARTPRRSTWFRRAGPVALTEGLADDLEKCSHEGGAFSQSLRRALLASEPEPLRETLRTTVARILKARVRLAPLLRQLHHVGLLGLAAPEVEAVIHQVHYDARHSFTTGIHGIETLDAFDDLWLGQLEKEEPHLTRIASGVLRPWVVRLAALCHDLGKIDPSRGHGEAGAPIAEAFALRLGFDDDDARDVGRLVERHAAIPSLAFGRDLEDPVTWADARAVAGDPATLESLVVLAAADLKATHLESASGLWSGWKRDLLLSLCARTFEASDDDTSEKRRARIRQEVLAMADRNGPAGIPALWDRVPHREAVQIPPDLLFQLLSLALAAREQPSRWRVEERGNGIAEILAVAHATPRLLSSVMGALTALHVDILSLQAHSWSDGTVHLWVRVAHRGELPPQADIVKRLERSLSAKPTTTESVRRGLPNRRGEAVPVPVRVRLLDDGGPFHTALEVRCRDRKGLLRDLASCFETLQLTVAYALVTTVGPMAQDVFHLKDVFGGRVDGADKIHTLLHAVEAVAREQPGCR